MKCIGCGQDSKYRERAKQRCPRCGAPFAFEPQAGDPVTDMAFKHAIEAVSANGRVRWGVEHLHYEICRRKRPSLTVILVLGAIPVVCGGVVVILTGALKTASWLVVLLAVLAVIGILTSVVKARAPLIRVDIPTFDRLWKRWCSVHGTPEGVIVRKPKSSGPSAAEPDLADYSFDRAVICDRARTVDLLLANNFHFENNCAILSIDGYPPGPFPTVRAMIRRNPKLQVFALHDATPSGCNLAHRLVSDPDWFGGRVKVIDVGLRPGHAGRLRGLFREAEVGHLAAGEGITEFEARWLARYILELAVFRPERVLKRLFQAIHHPINPDDHPGDVIFLAPFTSNIRETSGPPDSFG
jgi:hypothetical protein